MATLTPTLTLASTDVSSDTLSLSVNDALSVGAPSQSVSRTSVLHSATTAILTSANTTTTYVYLKNTDGTNHVKIYTGADELWGIIWPGEFNFFAVIDGEGLKLQANNASCEVEYGYWTKA